MDEALENLNLTGEAGGHLLRRYEISIHAKSFGPYNEGALKYMAHMIINGRGENDVDNLSYPNPDTADPVLLSDPVHTVGLQLLVYQHMQSPNKLAEQNTAVFDPLATPRVASRHGSRPGRASRAATPCGTTPCHQYDASVANFAWTVCLVDASSPSSFDGCFGMWVFW
jgi:hypothetical protein